MSILVSDPGFLPTTRQLALAFADELDAYVTSFATPSLLGLGRAARRRAPRPLGARSRAAAPVTEALRVGLRPLGVAAVESRLLWRRNRMTDAAVAASVRAGSTVIASYGGALASFGRVRALGGVAVLDQPIARLETVQAILREELERRPELAPTIEPELLRPAERERLERELELADLIVVGSRFAARSLEDHAARVLVAPYGVDSTRFAPAPPGERRPGPLRVLFCGQLTARKGIGDLLDAAALLDPARFGFVLAGPHVRGSSLGTLAPNVRVVGAVAPVRMPDLYRSADVFVLPSLAEGSAVVVLEAMASALPVVVTESTGADAVRDGCEGIVVPARAPEAIAAALERLAGDADLRERLGRTARARVLERDWTTFGACVRERVAELRESARV